MRAFFDISDPSEDLDLDGLLMGIEEFDIEEVISTFLTSLSAGPQDGTPTPFGLLSAPDGLVRTQAEEQEAEAEEQEDPTEYGAFDTDDEVWAPTYVPRPPKGPRISGCSAHQSTAKDETRSPMDSDDIEADAAQCLQLPAELCPRPPELCPEPSGDEDGLATCSSQLSGVTPEVAHRPMKPGKGRAKVDEFGGRTVRLALSAENSRRDAENSRSDSVTSL